MYDDISDLSSELSSAPSSPVLPPDFLPTPASSQNAEKKPTDADSDMPPARKRRKIEPQPRSTQHLNLRPNAQPSLSEQDVPLNLLLKALRKRRKIVVIAGAGISVSAGIPDFRSSHGLFKSLRNEHKLKTSGKHLFDASVYKNDSSTSSFHDMVRSLSDMASTARPTAFHRLLARLSQEGRLLRLYTQNVDGIDTSLPPLATQVPLGHKAPWPKTVQLHGGLEKMVCQKCRHTSEFQPELFQGPEPPLCPECMEKDSVRTKHAGKRSHGIGKLRPRIVLYNEHNPDEEAIGAVVTSDLRSRPDAVIVVGTSLKIPGVRRIVREMCGVTRSRKNGISVWINQDSIPFGKDFESCWDLVVKGDSDEVARLAALKEWDDSSVETVDECTSSDIERVKKKQGPISVVVHSPSKKAVISESGIMTPPVSHDEMSDRAAIANPPQKKTKNPASIGRSIADVLGKENQGKSAPRRSATTAGKKSKKPDSAQVKIAAKVTKAKVGHLEDKTKTASTLPMVCVPPLASRNNGPVLFPNLQRLPSKFEPTPPDSPSSEAWRDSRETISPTGSIPADLVRLLN
ncbi:MAG: hypothetical protein Q9227_000807 [Pyrenula ochraceoflavens]